MSTTESRFLKAREVAIELNCHVYTVYDLLRNGVLVGIKLKKRWRVKRVELDKFIEREGKIN